jgi:glutathione S-transferase
MPTLYYSPGACSLASHIVLEEIGRPYDTVEVNLRRGDHLKPDYLALNPHARVPTLEVGAFILTECPAILTYLDRVNPDAGLLPDDPAAEAQGLSMMSWLASSVHISFAQIWRAQRFSEDSGHHEAISASGRAAVLRQFAEIESQLGGGQWALGRHYSVLDPYLLVFNRWGYRIGLDMAANYPNYVAHAARVGARRAVQRVIAKEGISLTA